MEYQRLVEEARKRVREVTPEEAREALESGGVALLLDVREPVEWAGGRIPGAVHIPMGKLRTQADARSPMANQDLVSKSGGTIIVYCARGNRSVLVADAMKAMGYSDVASMSSGIIGWARLGYPVERPPAGA